MRPVLISALLLLVTLLTIGCGPGPAGNTGNKVDIRGTITSLSPADEQAKAAGTLGSILVEGTVEKDTSFDKASIRITDKTRILERQAQGEVEVNFDTFKLGQTVEAKFTGPVAESYPVQAVAGEVIILR